MTTTTRTRQRDPIPCASPYEFRVHDGTWQRRLLTGGSWQTLSVITGTPKDTPARADRSRQVPKSRNRLVWS